MGAPVPVRDEVPPGRLRRLARKECTRQAFGTAIWPHLFRDCAVTELVDCAPEEIGIAPDLLGHAGLQLAPELVEEFARAFQDEVNRLAAEQVGRRARKLASMIRAIDDGLYQPSMKERMAELEAEKAVLQERLAATPEPPKVRLHPNLAGLYREKVAALEQALADPAIKAEAAGVIRSHIDRITLTPNAEGGLDVQLYGDLARILQFCEMGERNDKRPGHGGPGRGLSVVAGAGFGLCALFVAPGLEKLGHRM